MFDEVILIPRRNGPSAASDIRGFITADGFRNFQMVPKYYEILAAIENLSQKKQTQTNMNEYWMSLLKPEHSCQMTKKATTTAWFKGKGSREPENNL